MIISSIELINIRSYIKEKINFERGITFLSGDIGSGKSSILQAIEFALFGFKRGDLEGYHLLRKGEEKGEVTLELKSENEILKIKRKIKKTKSGIIQDNGEITINNSNEELAPTEITAKIFEFLNFPKEFLSKDRNLLYRFSTYTPQEQLKEILYSEHEKRLEIIRKLFRIDKYKNLQNASDLYLKDLRDRKILIKGKLEDNFDIEDEFKKINEEIQKLEIKKEEVEIKIKPFYEKNIEYKEKKKLIEEKINSLRDKEITIEKNLSKIDEIKKQKENLVKEKNEFNLNEINSELKKISLNIENKNKENQKLEVEFKLESQRKINLIKKSEEINLKKINNEKSKIQLKEKEEMLNQIKEEIKKNTKIIIKSRIKDIEVKINKNITKIKKIQKKEEEIKEDIEKQKEIEFNLKEKQKEIEHKKKHLNNIYGISKCEFCEQDISIAHREEIKKNSNLIIKENEKYIELKLKELKGIENKIEILNLEILELKELEIENVKLNEKKDNTLKELKEKELKYIQDKEKLENIESEIKKIKLEIKTNDEKEEEKIKLEIKTNDEKIDKIKENINSNKINTQKLIHSKSIYDEKIKQDKINDEKIKKIELNILKEIPFRENLKKIKENLINLNSKLKIIITNIEKLSKKENEYLITLSEIKTNLKNKRENLDKISIKIEKYRNYKKEFDKINDEYEFIDKKIIPTSLQIEKNLFTKFLVEFNENFIKIFKELIENQEFDVFLKDDFSIVVEQNGYEIDISNLSGGEKSSLAVAYRLALKSIIESNLSNLNMLNLIILDEPTDGFSEQQVSRLGYLLKESNLEQIILVSHDEKIESIAEKILHVEKIHHESKVN